ncbi:MAG: M4 family metallopeptidase [Bacteroidales bacterium]
MKTLMKKILIFIAIVLLHFTLFAQLAVKEKYMGNDSIPRLIVFEENNLKSAVSSVFKEHLNLTQDDDLVYKSEFTDDLGETHQIYQQFYKGIKVESGIYKMHTKNGMIKAISGNFVKSDIISTVPTLPEKDALELAIKEIGAKTYIWDQIKDNEWAAKEQLNNNAKLVADPELVIWSNVNNTVFKLAYKFDIYALEPLSRDYVFIDANSGKILWKEPILKNTAATGTLTTRYSGNKTSITDRTTDANFRLVDVTRGNGIYTRDMNTGTNFSAAVDFVDNDNTWTAGEWHNVNEDDAALEAHWALQQVYDYFKNVHNRNSFNNSGATVNCYVHYRSNWDNGGWDGSRIILGDGDITFDNVCSLDALAHEFGHAVCTYTCNLTYWGESGALNEGLSDIWAACVENYAAPEKQNWRIGEEITLLTPFLRAMDDPNLITYRPNGIDPPVVYPDTYQGAGWYTGTWDNAGVHINNTVLSHWFFLVANGGIGTNDNGDFFRCDKIGITNAAKIVYRMESVYLSSNANFADARIQSVQAAKDIYGENSTATYATAYAWYAVGVGDEPSPLNNDIVGPTQLTPGYGASYSVTNDVTATNYVWTIPSGCYANYCWNIISGQGTPSIRITAGAVGSGTIKCKVYRNSTLVTTKSLFINVQNPYGGGGGSGDDPCAGSDGGILPIINGVIYPPDPCDPNALSVEESIFVSIEVYDIMGHKITESNNALQYNTSELSCGVYIIKALANNGKYYSVKFVNN